MDQSSARLDRPIRLVERLHRRDPDVLAAIGCKGEETGSTSLPCPRKYGDRRPLDVENGCAGMKPVPGRFRSIDQEWRGEIAVHGYVERNTRGSGFCWVRGAISTSSIASRSRSRPSFCRTRRTARSIFTPRPRRPSVAARRIGCDVSGCDVSDDSPFWARTAREGRRPHSLARPRHCLPLDPHRLTRKLHDFYLHGEHCRKIASAEAAGRIPKGRDDTLIGYLPSASLLS